MFSGDPEGEWYRMQHFFSGWYPVKIPKELLAKPHVGKALRLTLEERAQVAKDYREHSLRQLAQRYGVSYETIRRALKV